MYRDYIFEENGRNHTHWLRVAVLCHHQEMKACVLLDYL